MSEWGTEVALAARGESTDEADIMATSVVVVAAADGALETRRLRPPPGAVGEPWAPLSCSRAGGASKFIASEAAAADDDDDDDDDDGAAK